MPKFALGDADHLEVSIPVTSHTAEEQIAHLSAQLEAALHRANVAEEQLRRVHAAVRAFKARQLAAKRAASAAAQVPQQPQAPSGMFQPWVAEDPTLDSRFQDFLDGEGEADAARRWILEDD